MPNAFYRNSSSSGKKKNERESYLSSFFSRDASLDTPPAEPQAPPPASGKTVHSGSSGDGLSWMVRMTPSALVTISVLTAVLLGFSFLCGIIVGRGTIPVPQAVELDPLLEADAQDGAEGESAPEKILPKEELRFMSSLRGENGSGILSGETKPASPQAVVKTPATEPARQPEVRVQQDPQTDYVLRVAAFKDASSAQTLRARLSKDGLNARCTRTKTSRGTWHYVQVTARVTDAGFQELGRQLSQRGLKDFMVISRKPVAKR